MEEKDQSYHLKQGRILRGIINSIKRRPEDAAQELNISVDRLNAIIAGQEPLSEDLVRKATKVWSINQAVFYPLHDDCPQGVKIMRAESSFQSKRIMQRAGKDYYEYRDTVMSTVGLFYPEWIKELCIVDDNDPHNPNVQWNNGHFPHQFTYFIGPVNFYYQGSDGEKKVAVMNTGDSMYITPFIPHTFTTRKNEQGEMGLILALTYGNKIDGSAKEELSAIGLESAKHFALDFSSREKAAGSILKYYREAASIGLKELSKRTAIPLEMLEQYEQGKIITLGNNLQKIASALTVDTRDLLPPDLIHDKVILGKYDQSPRWDFPDTDSAYTMVELAGMKHLPHSKALEVSVYKKEKGNLDLKFGLHQYGYNIGETAVKIHWKINFKDYEEVVQPGDSFYIKPFMVHSFRIDNSAGNGKLLILRIGGRVVGDAQRELSLIGKQHTERAISETTAWYDPKGKNKI